MTLILNRRMLMRLQRYNDCGINLSHNDYVYYGHLSLLRYYLKINFDITISKFLMDLAAGNGHLHIVKWIHFNRDEGCSHEAMDWAAEDGHLDVIEWLHENRTEGCTEQAVLKAAGNGHLHIIKWLKNHNKITLLSNLNAQQYALAYNNTNIVTYLRQHYCVKN
jgi:hypothetical protein